MATHDDSEGIEDQLAESMAQIESLQAAAADAEARAATALSELTEARRHAAEIEEQLACMTTEREAAHAELYETREALSAARTAIREAASKYRAAVLAAAPEIPGDLVPEVENVAEIDRGLEAARLVVGRVREKIEEEALGQARSLRVPAGAPSRRAPDLSSLSPEEKIRAGLQQAADREGR